MKILKKSLALFLIVALFASMSIMVFAEFDYSVYDSGTFERKTWNATLKYQNNRTTATAEISWYGAGTVSVSWSSFRYVQGSQVKRIISSNIGNGVARVTKNCPSGCRFNEINAYYKIRTKDIAHLIT